MSWTWLSNQSTPPPSSLRVPYLFNLLMALCSLNVGSQKYPIPCKSRQDRPDEKLQGSPPAVNAGPHTALHGGVEHDSWVFETLPGRKQLRAWSDSLFFFFFWGRIHCMCVFWGALVGSRFPYFLCHCLCFRPLGPSMQPWPIYLSNLKDHQL